MRNPELLCSSNKFPKPQSLKECTVSVLGLGLIGGSLAWALKQTGAARQVIGYEPDSESSQRAVDKGIVDAVTKDPEEAASLADILVLAVPVDAIVSVFSDCQKSLKPNTVVTDVGSSKSEVIKALEPMIPDECEYIGGHPMAGSEASGIEAASPGLFHETMYVLCPTLKTKRLSRLLIQEMVLSISAIPIWIDAPTHDAGVAYISHLPHLVAATLVRTTMRAKNGVVDILASGGYRDTTRVARSEPSMSASFCVTNQKYVLEAASIFRSQFDEAIRVLTDEESGQGNALATFLDEAREYRTTLGIKKGWDQKRLKRGLIAPGPGKSQTRHDTVYVPPAKSPIHACIKMPGDKSISHRVLILASLAGGTSSFRNVSTGTDLVSSIEALKAMGVDIVVEDNSEDKTGMAGIKNDSTGSNAGSSPMPGRTVTVCGAGISGLKEPDSIIDCGNSGTTMRLLTGVLAAFPFLSVLSGDESLRSRPMARVIEPLTNMGAKIMARSGGRLAPLAITGGSLHDFDYRLPVPSAQVKSALLLAGLCSGKQVTVVERIPSRDHTERLLPLFGAPLEFSQSTPSGEKIATIARPENSDVSDLCPTTFTVPGDISSAAFFMVAASLLPGSYLEMNDLLLNPLRTGILRVLERMGVQVIVQVKEEYPEPRGTVIIKAPVERLRPVEISGALVPELIDEIPIIAVAATQAEGATVIKDAAELRVKEVDRVKAVGNNLSEIGAKVIEHPDGMVIEGPVQLLGGTIDSFGDHRIAMAMAIASFLSKDGIYIRQGNCVDISFPGFFDTLQDLCI